MGKKYADYMDEISADDIYKGLLAFGLFSNKIPPVFSSTPFFDYCVNNHPSFSTRFTSFFHQFTCNRSLIMVQ